MGVNLIVFEYDNFAGRPDYQVSLKRGFKEDPYIFFDKDSEFFDTIK